MKLHIVSSDLNENFPIGLLDLDANGSVVARFKDEPDARTWAALRHYEIQEKN